MNIPVQPTRTMPSQAAPASAQVGLQRGPSESDMLASMLGEAPREEKAEPDEKKKRPAAPSGQQSDRSGRRASPGEPAPSDGEIEEEDDPSSLLEEGSGTPPADDDDDETDADEAGDDADDDEDDADEADPLDDLFADHEGDDEGKDDEFDASKLGDNVKLSVTVDGEEQEVTLGDLKRRYAGEGAIERRLQDATELRTHAQKDYEKTQATALGLLQAMGNALFRRTVQEPTPELRQRNATQYLIQKDLYDQETTALHEQRVGIETMIAQLETHEVERQKTVRQQAGQQLRKIMPVLADPVKGPKVRDALISAAKEIGYTDADIAACTDPLMFKTVALAARELKRMKGAGVKKAEEKTRTIAAKGSQNRSAARVDAKAQEKKALQRARTNPTDDNLMATLLAPAPKKPRRR